MLPLEGMRVLEIGGGVPAAFATRWLAGYGADVVRSEGPAGALDGDEEVALLPGKRRVAVSDSQLRALALAADVVIEDGKPGQLAARGLDPRDAPRSRSPPSSSPPSPPSARQARRPAGRRPTSSPTPPAASSPSPACAAARRSRTAPTRP